MGAVEGAHGSVVLVKVNGEIAAYGQIEGENGGDITVDMSAFAPGVYDVSVGTSSSTQGYRGGMVDTTVQVLDRNAPVMSLPASLTAIEQEAFCGLPARVVSVPASVTAIGSRAFADCASLGFVIFEGDGGSIAGDAFTGSPYVTFLCPDGSAAARYADAHGIGHRPR